MTNLEYYIASQEALPREDSRRMDDYFIGYISVDVPEEVWKKAVDHCKEKAIARGKEVHG